MTKPSGDSARAELERRAIERARNDTVLWTELWRPKIRTKSGKIETFVAMPFQTDVLGVMDSGRNVFINKGRQEGLSTITCLQKLRRMIEVPGVQVLIISKDLDSAKHIKHITRRAYDTVIMDGKPHIERDNMTELVLSNGSGMQVEAATETAGRSLSITDLVLDEAAHMDHIDTIWTAAVPTIGDGGTITVLSTPNGEGNWYHTMWNDLVDPVLVGDVGEVGETDEWTAFRLPWTVVPGRDDEWRAKEMERLRLTEMGWEQEFECSFNASSENILRTHHIDECVVQSVDSRTPPRHIIGVDVAGGGRDESAITVVECSQKPFLVVEQEASKEMDTVELRKTIREIWNRYPDAMIVIDNTGIGIGVSQSLSKDDGVTHKRMTFTSGARSSWSGEDAVSVPRQDLLSTTVRLFEGGHVRVPEEMSGLITSIRTARWGSKRSGRFPDRLDSLMIALWMADNTEPESESWMGDSEWLKELGIEMDTEGDE